MSAMSDSFRILKHLSIYRVWNLILLKKSYYLSRLTKRAVTWGKPFSLSIEPTTACNLGCPECPSGLKAFTRPTGKLDLLLHEKMLNQVSKSVFYINYYFQGEPFLHPQFLELIRQAKKHKIYTATSTNAHLIDQKKAEEIFYSLSNKDYPEAQFNFAWAMSKKDDQNPKDVINLALGIHHKYISDKKNNHIIR
jgi:organic radical activating enzyme